MSYGDLIKQKRKALGLSAEDLAERAGVSPATIYRYENGTISGPRMTILRRIAGALGEEAADLVDRADGAVPDDANGLNPEELDLVRKYRELDGFGRRAVNAVLDIECERVRKGVSKAPAREAGRIVYLRRYMSPAAGAPLFAEQDYEDAGYPAADVPEGTSYAVGISGHSMEPELPDGCTVFVERTEAVADGDIVIAWIDGEGTVCKRAVLDGDRIIRLESANPEYPDIAGADLNGLRVYGRVLGYAND